MIASAAIDSAGFDAETLDSATVHADFEDPGGGDGAIVAAVEAALKSTWTNPADHSVHGPGQLTRDFNTETWAQPGESGGRAGDHDGSAVAVLDQARLPAESMSSLLRVLSGPQNHTRR